MAADLSVDDRVDASTLHLLRTGGPRAVTVEAVSKSSGVAKTTIYRRHQNRQDLMRAALARLTSLPPLAPATEPAERLRWLIGHAIAKVEDGVGLGGVAAMLTDDDPEFTRLMRASLIEQRGHLENAIAMSTADGSFRADIDGPTLIDAIVGAYIAEHARSDNVPPAWGERLFEFFWPFVRGD